MRNKRGGLKPNWGYYRKLSELTAEIHQVGVNYNQVVRLLHFTSDKNVHNLLREPYKFTEEVKQLQQQAVELTEKDRNI
ncbi:hypothetical protein [uncultured Alloprevotella sp.]|uniref:plasmid mobilization protein n=1 Tax=uncultured Alloprevotella sp. TaxID=1283315 RepID=UPI002633A6ED|nr:hypothetical protein [uncultured Alloprevotella sp.]